MDLVDYLYYHKLNKKKLKIIKNNWLKLINKTKRKKRKKITITSRKFSNKILKKLSKNYTKPVIFKNQKDNYPFLKFGNNIQIRDKNGKIKFKNFKDIKKTDVIFNDTHTNCQYNKIKNKELFSNSIYIDRFISKHIYLTSIHSESNSTLNIQVKGNKKWILLEPNRNNDKLLIPIYIPKQKNRVVVSSIVQNNHIHKILNKKCSYYEFTMKENYILFVPKWYWHQTETNVPSYSIAMRTVYNGLDHEIYNKMNLKNFMIRNLPISLLIFLRFKLEKEKTDNSGINEIKKFYKKELKYLN